MTTAVIPYQVDGVAIAGTPAEWGELNTEQIELLKRTIAKGSTDAELDMFVQVCRGLRLSPFANRQIQWIRRRAQDPETKQWRDTMSIQIGIDGYRLLAERTGKYLGSGEPEFCGPDELWRRLWLREEPPAACRVGVWRAGAPAPIWGVVVWREEVQLVDEYGADGKKTGRKAPNSMWASRPTRMLAKVAEALALRKAFPAELAGLSLNVDADELPAAPRPTIRARVTDLYEPPPEPDPPAPLGSPAKPPPRPDRPAPAMAEASVIPPNPNARVTDQQMKAIHAIAKDKLGWAHEELTALCRYVVTGLPSMNELTRDQAADFIKLLQATDAERLVSMLAEAFEAAEAGGGDPESPPFPEHEPADPPDRVGDQPGFAGMEQRAYHDDARGRR